MVILILWPWGGHGGGMVYLTNFRTTKLILFNSGMDYLKKSSRGRGVGYSLGKLSKLKMAKERKKIRLGGGRHSGFCEPLCDP